MIEISSNELVALMALCFATGVVAGMAIYLNKGIGK